MMDWSVVVKSAIWMVGLAWLLATLSIARSFDENMSVRHLLSQPAFRFAIDVGILLFAIGVMLSVENGYERAG